MTTRMQVFNDLADQGFFRNLGISDLDDTEAFADTIDGIAADVGGMNGTELGIYSLAYAPMYDVADEPDEGELGKSVLKKIKERHKRFMRKGRKLLKKAKKKLRKIGKKIKNFFKAVGKWFKKNWKKVVKWVCRIAGAIIALLPFPGAALVGAAIIATAELIIGVSSAIKAKTEGKSTKECFKMLGMSIVKSGISFASQVVGKYTSGKAELGPKAKAVLDKIKDSPLGKEAAKLTKELTKAKEGSPQYKEKYDRLQEIANEMEPDAVEADKEIANDYWSGVKVNKEWREEECIFREDEQGQLWGMWDGGVPPDGIKANVWYRMNGSMAGGMEPGKMDKDAKKAFQDLVKNNTDPELHGSTEEMRKKVAEGYKKLKDESKNPILAKGAKHVRVRKLSKEEQDRLLKKTSTTNRRKLSTALRQGKTLYTMGNTNRIAAAARVETATKVLQEGKRPWYKSPYMWVLLPLGVGGAAMVVRRARR